MKKGKLLLGLIILAGIREGYSQVRGVSYTLKPQFEIHQWDKKLGLGKNGQMAGVQLGFGFGQHVELSANYLRSLDLKRDFSRLEDFSGDLSLFPEKEVTIEKYGGEVKLNLNNKAIIPYLTFGTGIQKSKLDSTNETKTIYYDYGAGFQFSPSERFTLALGIKNNNLNFSPLRAFTDKVEQSRLSESDLASDLRSYWTYTGSLIFYMGGQDPRKYKAPKAAYSGFSLPIEGVVGMLNFDKSLGLEDRKYVGFGSGFDIGPYVGIRGYYWRTTGDKYFEETERLAIYGVDANFKLNASYGLNPYLTVGYGEINALSGYEGKEEAFEDIPFASGGAGIDIPFSKNFKISGYAKALLTSSTNLENSSDPEDINTSWAYGLKASIILGANARRKSAYQSVAEKETKIENEYDATYEKLKRENEALKERLKQKEKELEKKTSEEAESEAEDVSERDGKIDKDAAQELIRKSRAENEKQVERIENKIEKMEERQKGQFEELRDAINDMNRQNTKSIRREKEVIESMNEIKKESQTVPITMSQVDTSMTPQSKITKVPNPASSGKAADTTHFFVYNHSDVLAGINIGGDFTINIGVRPKFAVRKSSFLFAPEAFIGFGGNNSWGLSGNFIYELKEGKSIKPYVGAGLGFLGIEDKTKLVPNIIVGAYVLKIWKGDFFIDYTNRNFFKYNQLSAGYRLGF